MSKASPPPSTSEQHHSSSDDDHNDAASLQHKRQLAWTESRHNDERSYYYGDESSYKHIGRDDHLTPKLPLPADKHAPTSGSHDSIILKSAFQPCTQRSQVDISSTLAIKRASSSSYDMRNEIAPSISAYFLYQNATRDHFRSLNPSLSQGELSKYISQQYKSLDPREKAAWTAQAFQTKAATEGNCANPFVTPQKPPSRKRKDSHTPKRAVGAYVFFTKDERPKVQQEFKGIQFAEIGKILGERWRGLGLDERRKYEMMAAQDRERFYNETQSRQEKARKTRVDNDDHQRQYQHQHKHLHKGSPLHDVDDVNGNDSNYRYSDDFFFDTIKELSDE